jgi:hypothetical protein
MSGLRVSRFGRRWRTHATRGSWRCSSMTCRLGSCARSKTAGRVTPRGREVLHAARASGVRTVFVRHVTMPRRLMGAAQLRMWKAWQRRESAAEPVQTAADCGSAALPAACHAELSPLCM